MFKIPDDAESLICKADNANVLQFNNCGRSDQRCWDISAVGVICPKYEPSNTNTGLSVTALVKDAPVYGSVIVAVVEFTYVNFAIRKLHTTVCVPDDPDDVKVITVPSIALASVVANEIVFASILMM